MLKREMMYIMTSILNKISGSNVKGSTDKNLEEMISKNINVTSTHPITGYDLTNNNGGGSSTAGKRVS